MNKKWGFYEIEEDMVKEIANKHGITEVLARILINRGITEDEEIEISVFW